MILILSPYLFLRNVLFRHEFVDEFFANFVHEFKYEIRTNSHVCIFLHEKLVMLRMACTVIRCGPWALIYPDCAAFHKISGQN